ncbi:hypothetical protein LXL04_009393 [Taraxacum kok-saghyz]
MLSGQRPRRNPRRAGNLHIFISIYFPSRTLDRRRHSPATSIFATSEHANPKLKYSNIDSADDPAQVLAAKRATGFNYSTIQLQQYSITAEFNYITQHYNQPNRAL